MVSFFHFKLISGLNSCQNLNIYVLFLKMYRLQDSYYCRMLKANRRCIHLLLAKSMCYKKFCTLLKLNAAKIALCNNTNTFSDSPTLFFSKWDETLSDVNRIVLIMTNNIMIYIYIYYNDQYPWDIFFGILYKTKKASSYI